MEDIALRYELGKRDRQALGRDIAHATVTILLFALLVGFWAWLWVKPPF